MKAKDNKTTGSQIVDDVKKYMKYSKRDLAVMLANLNYCYNQLSAKAYIKK